MSKSPQHQRHTNTLVNDMEILDSGLGRWLNGYTIAIQAWGPDYGSPSQCGCGAWAKKSTNMDMKLGMEEPMWT